MTQSRAPLLAALLDRLTTCPKCGQPGKHNLDPRGFFDLWACQMGRKAPQSTI